MLAFKQQPDRRCYGKMESLIEGHTVRIFLLNTTHPDGKTC